MAIMEISIKPISGDSRENWQ